MKIKINPDKDHVEAMRIALKNNDGYCPCSTEKSKDTKCMCKNFREMKSGWCHCYLYLKEEEN